MRLRIRIRLWPAMGQISMALLPTVVLIALLIFGGYSAFSQGSTGTVVQAPLFTAIDLHPRGFLRSWASSVSGGQQVGYGWGPTTKDQPALLWHGSAASVLDLTGGFSSAQAIATSGEEQVGWGSGPSTVGENHALLWRGSATSVVDLNPSGSVQSSAFGVSEGQQVGSGDILLANGGRGVHALLWHGTAASVVDLHPRGFLTSVAKGISGGLQVGWGLVPPTNHSHALLWRGSAASVVDLNPRGFGESWAYGVSDGQEVGSGWRNTGPGRNCAHALLWRGSAASGVDLNPQSGFECSVAVATSGEWQVGSGSGPGRVDHALLWHGSAASVVDLHAFLPPDLYKYESHAFGIDSNGDIVGEAWPIGSDGPHAILWVRAK